MYTTRPTRSDSCRSRPARQSQSLRRDEQGFALIVTMVILISLAILGSIAVQSAIKETKLAASDKRYKDAFYRADGTSELATELLEQNIESVTGFAFTTIGDQINLTNVNFWMNPIGEATTPRDDNRDFFLEDASDAAQRTNVKIGGRPEITHGGAIQMAAGYEGRGKSSAQGGTNLLYKINVQHVGLKNSESIVRIDWRHVN